MNSKISFKIKIKFFIIIVTYLLIFACAKVNPTAPDGSILFVTANPTSIPSGGASSTITVIGFESTGIPISNKTVLYFITDIGSINETAMTHDGVAKAIFTSDRRSGVAHISVISGNAKSNIEVTVGSAALSSLTIGANPGILPIGGGRITITAVAFDSIGNTLSNIPIIFSTTSGSLDSGGSALYTDQNGVAKDFLTTDREATVTATSGTKTASIKVSEEANKAPTASFVFSPASPGVGESIYFNASSSSDSDGNIVSFEWDFGNGFYGRGEKATHAYTKSGSYMVTLVVTDNEGSKGTNSQTVTVSEPS